MPWVSYGQKGEGTKTSGSWQPYGTKKKQDKKKAVIEESLKQAEKYQAEAEKYAGRVDMIEGIGKTLVRPFISLAEIPKNVYGSVSGKQNTFGDVNVPGLGKVQSYQEEAKGVTGDILEGKKPLYSILKPMGSAAIDTAGLGIGSSVAKGVTKEAFKQTAKRLIPEGAAYGLGQGAVDSIGNGRTYGEKAKDIATSTAFGAVGAPLFGVGFNVIGRAVSSLGSKLSGRATKALDPKEVKSTVDEIVGIVDRDLKPEEEQMVMESLSKGATKEEVVTEVGKANIEAGFDPSIRLAQVVDELEAGGKKLSLDEIATVKKGMDEGKSFEEIQSEIQSTLEPQKALSTAPKEETGATVPKDTSDNGDEAFLKAVEERFKASKTNKFREAMPTGRQATKDEKGRFTGSKSEARMKTGDPERDALSESIQTRIDSLGKDELNKTTQSNFDDTSQRLKLEEIQSQIPKAKAEELPRLKEESDRIIKEILDKRAVEFKATSRKEDLIQKTRTIANNSNSSLEFRINLRKEGLDNAFKSQQAAEEFYRRMNGAKYRLADEDPLIQEARKYTSPEEFVNAQGKPFYHGSRNIWEGEFKNPKKGEYGSEAIFVAPSESTASYYDRGGGVKEAYISKNAKIWDYTDPKNQRLMEEIKKDAVFVKYIRDNWNIPLNEVVRKINRGEYEWVQRPEVLDFLRRKGFSGFVNMDYNGGQTIGIFSNKDVKTKSQLTDIWKKANQSAPEQTLINEARKYKSAEEFVKAQGEPVYHGTDANVAGGLRLGKDGSPIWLSKTESGSERYGKNLIQVNAKNTKLLDETNLAGLKESRRILEESGAKSFKDTKFQNALQKAGYDGIRLGNGNDIAIFNPNSVKTKSQLIDIWNKAHGEKYRVADGDTLLKEVRKYKSVEEFVRANRNTPEVLSAKSKIEEIQNRQDYKDFTKGGKITGKTWNDNIAAGKEYRKAIDENTDKLTEIWKKAHGEKSRDIAPRFEELTGTKITPEQEAQIKSLHKRMFGDENVEITAQILTPEGQKAFGVYQNKVIKILDGQVDPTDTFYHEAVHKYLDLFTTMDEQKSIYLEARKLWKTDNLDELEEKIAENFIRYAKTNEGVVGTMKVLFDKVIDRIKNALKGESSIEALYKDILEGKAKNRGQKVKVSKGKEPVTKQDVPKGKKVSIIASRLNKDLPPDFRIDETYDPKAINKEADRAAELIAENKTKAIQKALDTGTNPMERDAILIELSEIAKRDKDYGTLNDLFNKRSELIRSGAQSLNMEKASILLNPQEKYMRNVVNAKLGKVKISGKDLKPEELVAKRTGIVRETKDAVRKSFKIEDAQELFDKLLCK